MSTELDLSTEAGMAAAVRWVDMALGFVKEGGQWIIPRSNAVVTVISHNPKQVLLTNGAQDPAVERVLRKAGWAVNYKKA